METHFSDTVNFMINGPACLIETADIANDIAMVRRGTSIGMKTLTNLPDAEDYHGLLHFNIGNGYYCEFKIDLRSGNPIDYYDYEPLQCAKNYFRRALASDTISDDLRTQAMVNLANSFDSLGRKVEAIHLYEKVLDRDMTFAIAKANLSQALYSFAGICGEYRGVTLL